MVHHLGKTVCVSQLTRKKVSIILPFLLWATLTIQFFSNCLWAAPFAEQTEFIQPDHTSITLWGQGDEFYAVFETSSGYTVIFDPEQLAYFYAKRSDDGKSLQSTGVLAHHQPPPGIAKHIRIDVDAAATQAQSRRAQWNTETGLSDGWAQLKAKNLGTPIQPKDGVQLGPPATTTTGPKVGLTLLIDFPDAPATIPTSDIELLLNGDSFTGFGNNGSIKKYFSDVSGGRLSYTNVVIGYVRMTQPKSYYNNPNIDCGTQGRLLINDALAILKMRSDYTDTILPLLSPVTDNTVYVTAFNVFFAGGNSGVWGKGLWQHSSYLSPAVSLNNGKFLWRYQMTQMGNSPQIGTFSHETGHLLCNFPDLYDYGYDSSGGPGFFSLMGGPGGYGTNPCQLDAYLKLAAGWATVTDVTSASSLTGTLVAAPNTGNNHFYRYRKPGVSTEYYLLENRQQTDHDANIPGSGIFVWHVDELGDKNNQSLIPNSAHLNYELTLVQADNLWHFQNNNNYGDANDLYYQGNTAASYTNILDDWSAPNAHWWDGTSSGMNLNGFAPSGPSICFNIGGNAVPDFTLFATPPWLTVPRGTSLSTTISATACGGFSNGLALSASGVPMGATASFAPGSIASPSAGTSVLTLAAGASTPTGTYTVTVTGTGAGRTQTAAVSFTVPPPVNFKIDANGYSTLNEAYNGAPPIAGVTITILAISGEFVEDLDLNRGIDILLKGGHNQDFQTRSGTPTKLRGTLTITNGKLIVDEVTLI